MGPGFGGINLGGFALPDLNMDEINAGIASQLGPEIAKFLAEQELANATNEYEKDVAETKIEQINEFESGLGSLPPVVEEVMQTLSLPDEFKTIEAVSDRDFPRFAEPSAPMPSSIQETVKAALDKAIEEAPITPAEDDTFYNPNYFGFEDEKAIAMDNEIDQEYLNKVLADLEQTEQILPTTPPAPSSNEGFDFGAPANLGDTYYDPQLDTTYTYQEKPDGRGGFYSGWDITEGTGGTVGIDPPIIGGIGALPPTGGIGDFTDIVQLPEVDPTFTVAPQPAPSPIYGFEDPAAQTGSEAIYDPGYRRTNPATSNLIMQQREAYNSALRNPVYRAPDTVQPDYVRPMSAAEFGSVPGRYTPPVTGSNLVNNREQNINTDLGFLAMNRGGSLNNRMGLGGLPPMQQNDKLTQLFAQSFRPRR